MATAVTVNLSDLLAPQTAEEIFAQLLAYYQSSGFPVTSWQAGGTERTRLMAFSTVLQNISAQYIPQLAAAGFLDYAGNVSPEWLQLLAQQLFEVDFYPAGFTIGAIELISSPSAPAYTIAAGQLIAVFAQTGNRYINTSGGTLSTNSTLSLAFTSESPGAKYNDANNSACSLVTPLAGVTLMNVGSTFSAVTHLGTGTGTIVTSGSPSLNNSVTVLITTTGAAGAANWSYSLNGAPFVAVGSSASSSIGSSGITITLTNGMIGTSFVTGDQYLVQNPGDWRTQQGTDLESNASLVARCQARWSTLSPIPVSNFYYTLATSTPTVGGQVTQVDIFTDPVINNKVNIVVAGPAGALPGSVVTAIQAYINPRVPITEIPVVVSPGTVPVTIAASITMPASVFTTASLAIQIALTDYIVGGPINPLIYISRIIDLIMNVAGVTDVSSVTINGSAANVQIGSSSSFQVAALPSSLPFNSITYILT